MDYLSCVLSGMEAWVYLCFSNYKGGSTGGSSLEILENVPGCRVRITIPESKFPTCWILIVPSRPKNHEILKTKQIESSAPV